VLVDHYGLSIAFYLFAVLMFLSLLVVQRFAFGEPSGPAVQNGGLASLLRDRRGILFLLNTFFGGIGLFTVAAFLYPYLAEMNASETTMGVASLIATLTELPVFFFANRLLKRFSARGLFVVALILIGVRSLLFSVIAVPAMVLVLQVFSGMLFPAMWTAGVAYADQHAPAGLKSTAQGLFGAMSFGFGSAVGGLVGGILLGSVGARQMYFIFGLVILIGVGLVEVVRKLLPEATPASSSAGD
jgi:MFS family permease